MNVSNASLLSGASAARVSEKEGGHHEIRNLVKISHFDPEQLMGLSQSGGSDMFTQRPLSSHDGHGPGGALSSNDLISIEELQASQGMMERDHAQAYAEYQAAHRGGFGQKVLQTLCCCFPCLQRPEEEGKHEYNNVGVAHQVAVPNHELNLQ